jgi:hypothetical protein
LVREMYLDTARLGRMCPAAQRASQDFASLAGEVGAAIQLDRFLQHGISACQASTPARYPGLADWHGLADFKKRLARLAKLESDLPVLLASRSSQLMKFAATLLCRPCENVLVTDLGWPGYHRILEAECLRTNRRFTVVPLRDDLLRGAMDEDAVVDLLRAEYVEHGCDGLFLTAVSNLGLRLPVQRIYEAIKLVRRVRFVVVDGAQDFRHISSDLSDDCCDLYLAGCHKWLCAYYPLALAFYGRWRSKAMIETVLAEAIKTWQVDDPLLRLVEQLCRGRMPHGEETVNLSPLFSCQGAVSDAIRIDSAMNGDSYARVKNVEQTAAIAAAAGWIPRLPHPTLRSGVLLLQAERERTRRQPPDALRAAFYEHGAALSAYDDGLIRLSMPATPLRSDELELIEEALRRVA